MGSINFNMILIGIALTLWISLRTVDFLMV